MFHKVKSVSAMPGMRLSVQFSEGVTKLYDLAPALTRWPQFSALEEDPELFRSVEVDAGGYGIIWNDELDLSCDELFYNGVTVQTPFDGLISVGDATQLWGLSESTLRKAVAYGKLVNGIDVCKYGKQWVISRASMEREYGLADDS